jgi:hypothetical protein
VGTQLFAANRRITIFRAMGSAPTAAGVLIDFSAVPQLACGWIITEYANANMSGTNGSGAIVQSVSASGLSTTPSATLAALAAADNATYGSFLVNNTSGFTPGTGFAESADVNVSGLGSLMAEWRLDNSTTVNATCTNGDWGVVAIEIKVAVGLPIDNRVKFIEQRSNR